MNTRQPYLAAVVFAAACNLFDGSSTARYELVDVPEAVSPPVDGSVRLFGSGDIEWRRVFGGQTQPQTNSGKYTLDGDSLRVSWASDYWYTLGARRGDTLVISYSGAADEFHREFYVRR